MGVLFVESCFIHGATMKSLLLWPNGAPGAKGSTSEDCPRLTPYMPEGKGPFPAIIVCPGGGYVGRADHESAPIARWLCTLGVAGIVLDYRVSPYRHPIPLLDAQRAIRYARANAAELNILPDKIGILGFSAGGHLAASAATVFDAGNPQAADPIDRQSSRPDALIACYPVLTFGQHRHDGSMRTLLGDPVDAGMQEYMSLENRVTRQTPPSFLWHTFADDGVPVMNVLLFAEALTRCQVPYSLHVFPRGRHGLELAKGPEDPNAWTDLCATWLKETGFHA